MRGLRWLLALSTLALLTLDAPISARMRTPARYAPEKPLNFYVDALAGDDTASCETPGQACQTLQAAFDRIPVIIGQEVTVNVAAGTYRGGAILMDRLSPYGHPIRLRGESGMTVTPPQGDPIRFQGERGITVINGFGEMETGITVTRAPQVFLEGFTVTGFTRAGLSFVRTGPVGIAATRILSNPGVGIVACEADVAIQESVVDSSGGHGIVCDGGRLTFRALEGGNGVTVTRNGGNGIRVWDCHATFEGAALVSLNRSGLVAEHGGEINLMGRTDVVLYANTGLPGSGAPSPGDPYIDPAPLSELVLCEMIADNHGLVGGYQNAPWQGACQCLESRFGVCNSD